MGSGQLSEMRNFFIITKIVRARSHETFLDSFYYENNVLNYLSLISCKSSGKITSYQIIIY